MASGASAPIKVAVWIALFIGAAGLLFVLAPSILDSASDILVSVIGSFGDAVAEFVKAVFSELGKALVFVFILPFEVIINVVIDGVNVVPLVDIAGFDFTGDGVCDPGGFPPDGNADGRC